MPNAKIQLEHHLGPSEMGRLDGRVGQHLAWVGIPSRLPPFVHKVGEGVVEAEAHAHRKGFRPGEVAPKAQQPGEVIVFVKLGRIAIGSMLHGANLGVHGAQFDLVAVNGGPIE